MAVCGIYPLLDILKWNIRGQWMHLLYTKVFPGLWDVVYNVLKHLLPRFNKGAPGWFTCGWAYASLWDNNLTECATYRRKCRPNTAFALYYRTVAKDRLEDWIKNAADNVARPLVNALSGLLGSLLHGYATFSNWIESIRNIVGTYVPWWTTTLAAGLVWLRLKLPGAIRDATSTWSDIWEDIKTAVKDWAKTRFDAAMTWVANTAPGVVTWINTLGAWYNLVSAWVNAFKDNPYGTIAGTLGAAWDFLSGSWTGLRNFYNTVWVPFKVDLHDFLDHPMLFLYDLVDDEIEDHLETASRWAGKIVEKVIVWAWEET